MSLNTVEPGFGKTCHTIKLTLYDTLGIVPFDEFMFYAREQFLKIYNKDMYYCFTL